MQTSVLLVGAYGSGNLGDDVLLKIIADQLRPVVDPENTALLCRDAGYLERLAPGVQRIEKTTNYEIECGLRVYGGGTQFFRFRGQNSLTAKVSHALRHPGFAVRRLLKMNRQSIKARSDAMVGIGFGPFEDGSVPPGLADRINACDYLSVRDHWSYQFCRDAGNENVELSADLAFATPFADRLKTRGLQQQSSIQPEDGKSFSKFCFVFRDWTLGAAQQAYLEPSMATASQLADEGHEVDFVIFSRDPQLDRKRMEKIGQVVAWNPETMQEDEFIAAMADYDVIVTARFHGAVFGFLLDRPVVGICIDPKIERFLKSIGAEGSCWRMPFDSVTLKSLIRQASARRSNRSAAQRKAESDCLQQFTQQADRTLKRLRELAQSTVADTVPRA